MNTMSLTRRHGPRARAFESTFVSAIARALESAIAIACAALLIVAPMARAQDDEMPDGDVDLVEKPKPKKKEPKKDDKRKEEKKKEEPKREEPKREEPKKEPPPKREEPKKEPKTEPKRAPVDDDDDILTGGESGAKIAPRGDGKAVEPKAPDEDEDEDEGGGKSRLLQTVEEGPAPVTDEDDVPARPTKPLVVEDDEPSKAIVPVADDEEPPPVIKPGEGDVVEIEPSRAEVPDEEDDGGDNTWVIAGATAGGLLLLAGAGVGGFFLVDALTPKTGSIVVTPR